MAKLVARLLAKVSSQCSNPIISQKYKVGFISKGVANTLWPAKKIYKEVYKLPVRKDILPQVGENDSQTM